MPGTPDQSNLPAELGVTDAVGEAAWSLYGHPWALAVPAAASLPFLVAPALEPASWVSADLPLLGGAGENLVRLATIAVPSLLAGADAATFWRPFAVSPVALGDGATALVASALAVVGVMFAMLFRVWLAGIASAALPTPRETVTRSAVAAVQLVAAVAGALALVAILLAPVITASLAASLIGVDPVPSIVAAVVLLGGVAAIYATFVPDAIALRAAGPLGALRLSVAVVRTNPGATLRLVLYRLIVSLGVPAAVFGLTGSPIGLFVAILIHAYIATSLVLAGTLFFKDRLPIVPPREQGIARRSTPAHEIT